MAAGDIKGPEAVVVELTAGAAVTKGQLVHLEADGKWDPTADADTGKFAVAIEAASGDTVAFKAVVWGRVEVTATAATIAKGQCVMAGASGAVVATDYGAVGENAGTAMEAFSASGTGTIWVGLVN